MSNNSVVLSKKDLDQVLWRYIFVRQAPFNYETMQSGGFVWAMHPAMEKIYGDDDVIAKKYRSYFRFYNTHPWCGNIILGACLALESTKDESATDTAVELRTALMGPLAGLGDSIIWVLLMAVMGAIAGYQALNGSIGGWVIAEAVQLVIWFAFNKMFYIAYKQGVEFVTTRSAQLHNLTECASIVGIAVVGALIASIVNVHFGITMTVGEISQSLDDQLNSIIPCFGNIVAVVLIYKALGIKKMNSAKMVVYIIIISIILGATGILK